VKLRTFAATAAALTAVGGAAAPAHAATSVITGPSSSLAPYVLPAADGVTTESIITTGDPAGNGYRFSGTPDGLGAFKDGSNFGLLANHEFVPADGIVRRHGQKGSFVSSWTIDRRTLKVRSGGDFINPGVQFWNPAAQTYGTSPLAVATANPRNPLDLFPGDNSAFSRFCSSSLTDAGVLLSHHSDRGYGGQIYFANEETGDGGRTFGVTPDGNAQELPRLGRFSAENNLVADTESATTLVMGNEDGPSDGSQLRVYIGRKTRTGSAFRRAGLTNGASFVIDAANSAVTNDVTFRAAYPKGTPADVELNNVDWDQSGARQNAEAKADGLGLNRIEDGNFDPEHPDDYYFVTTAGGKGSGPGLRDGGGLWRLRFEDINEPELGGTLTLLLDGSETAGAAGGFYKPDNLTIDREGNIVIQEDPGNDAHVAQILAYSIESGKLGVVATFDPAKFTPGAPGFITQDEESSGVIDASKLLGEGWFLLDAQVHKLSADPELVEGGQLLALKVRDWDAVYGN
jgi:hypothetical protein